MLPDHELSIPPVPSPFLAPRTVPKSPLVDSHLGGTAIENAGAGLFVQTWTAQYAATQVLLSAPSVAPSVLFELDGIVEISLAFDQDMRPMLAYQLEAGGIGLYWYDPDEADYVTLNIAGAASPRVCLDVAEDAEVPDSDVLLTYIRAGALCFREQRDGFAVEYELYELPVTDDGYWIGRFGRNTGRRMQWEVLPGGTAPLPPVPTVFEVLDIPLLDEADAGFAPLLYLAAGGTLANWPGADVEISRDGGTTWQNLGSIPTASIIGELTTTLPDHTDAVPDETNEPRVQLLTYAAALQSTDADGLAALVNSAIVGDEELQFRDVAQFDPDEWDLSYLLRGIEGTAHASHAIGARFVFLDPTRLVRVSLQPSDIGEEIMIRARTKGGNVHVVRTFTFLGIAGGGS